MDTSAGKDEVVAVNATTSESSGLASSSADGGSRAAWVLVFGMGVLCLLATGLILGWAGFVLIFQGEDMYAYLCAPEERMCEKSQMQLNFVYTVGYVALAGSSLPAGILVDRCSPRAVVLSVMLMVTTGFLLLAFADPSGGIGILVSAFLLLGIAAPAAQLVALQFVVLIPKWAGSLTGVISGSLGMSALIPLLLHSVWQALGGQGHMRAVMVGYALVLVTFVLFAARLPNSQIRGDKLACHHSLARGFYIEAEAVTNTQASHPITDPSLYDQILSRDFLAFGVWFVTRYHFSGYYLGAVNLHLQVIAPVRVPELTLLFGWIAPCGIVIGPFMSWWVSMRSVGHKPAVVEAAFAVTVLQLLMCVIAWMGEPDLQFVAFACYTLSQEACFAIMFKWLEMRFGFANFGTLSGCLILISGLACFSINPMADAAYSSEDGFRMSFLALGLGTLVSFGLMAVVLCKDQCKRCSLPKLPPSGMAAAAEVQKA